MMVERATQDGSIRRVAHRQVDLFLDGISTSTEQARRGGSWVDPRPRPTTGWRGAPRLEPTAPP